MVLYYAVHQHLQERNWVSLKTDLCLTGCQKSLRESYKGNLPIHIAISRNCPEDIILNMIRIYPGSAKHKNYQGDLPLHYCAKFGGVSEVVVTALLIEYPDAMNVKTTYKPSGEFLTPREIARNNPLVSAEAREIFSLPFHHWTSLASHEKLLREKAFDTRLNKMQAQLNKSMENERKLVMRLLALEKQFSALERQGKAEMQNMEKALMKRIENEQEHIENMRQDITFLSHPCEKSQVKVNRIVSPGTVNKMRRFSSPCVRNRTAKYPLESFGSFDSSNDFSYIEAMYHHDRKPKEKSNKNAVQFKDVAGRRRRPRSIFDSMKNKWSKEKGEKLRRESKSMISKTAIELATESILPFND